jgi:MoaA/NifB/PqqE/SkfB family radical SAM enzyme
MKYELAVNQRLNRQFIPRYITDFNIETSGFCNLSCKFCAYSKKNVPKKIMGQELFEKIVNQAVELGFTVFELTPCTGDVFMDKDILSKLEFLDKKEGVERYSFFTNLTVPSRDKLLSLKKLKKMSGITISIYGHDKSTFCKITNSSEKLYNKLLENLNFLIEHYKEWPFNISAGFRSEFDAENKNNGSYLLKVIEKMRSIGIPINSSHGIFNNWGGYITQDDVNGLDMKILDNDFLPKRGACSRLIDSFLVTSSGIVNGCNCRDVDNQLEIGDINKNSLMEIISPNNPKYKKIIEDQQNGVFKEVCKNCDFYRSIYHQPKSFRSNNTVCMSVDDFFDAPFPKDRL